MQNDKECQFYSEVVHKALRPFLVKEAATKRCSVKKCSIEISQNSQENTCARDSFLIKLQA